jgi:ferrous iron transport protein B
MLISTGCGVPGIMASRTIENDSDRRMTVMTTTFMPCGAKLPIIALIAGALFPGQTWVGPSAYFLGIGAIVVSGIMLKKTKMFAGDPSPFVIELPAYHMPSITGVLRTMSSRGMAFVRKAGTLVLLATIAVWFLSSFNTSLRMVEDAGESILATLGGAIAPLFSPLGWGDWKAAVASITGLMAKENVVGTFGVLYGYADVAEDGVEYWAQLTAAFTQLSAYSFLVFNLLCAPCFAAIGALRREMMSAKWTWFAIGYQTVFAYTIALIVYQIGMLVQGNGFGVGTAFALAFAALIVYMLFIKRPYSPPKEQAPVACPAPEGVR